MTSKKTFTVQVTAYLRETPAEVFHALTDDGLMEAWGGSSGCVEPRIGGHFEMFDDWFKGEVLKYKPGKLLAYTWTGKDWKKEWEPSEVTLTFTKARWGTKVKVVHRKLPNRTQASWHRKGWKQYVFMPLGKYFRIPRKLRNRDRDRENVQ